MKCQRLRLQCKCNRFEEGLNLRGKGFSLGFDEYIKALILTCSYTNESIQQSIDCTVGISTERWVEYGRKVAGLAKTDNPSKSGVIFHVFTYSTSNLFLVLPILLLALFPAQRNSIRMPCGTPISTQSPAETCSTHSDSQTACTQKFHCINDTSCFCSITVLAILFMGGTADRNRRKHSRNVYFSKLVYLYH